MRRGVPREGREMKKGVVLRVERVRFPKAWAVYVNGLPLCRRWFERLTNIRLRPGESCRVRVERVK